MKGKEEFFPEMIRSLPEADIKLPGVKAYVLQGPDHQVMFFECAPGGEIPAHTHGAQFGVVLDGQFELTVGGETRIYRKGDTYYMPPNAVHSAKFTHQLYALDYFTDPHRYSIKKK